ncbi:MAG: hypothetical protein V1800_15885 [Candidatus Latescibacterota bacterium]
MLYQETKKHWSEYTSTVALLLANGRRDAVVIATMATESFFRPALHRSIESLYWFALDIIAPEKAKYISVGISQVQVRHWKETGVISCSVSRISTLFKFHNPLINYDVCTSFIGKASIRHESTENILREYTGKTTRYHALVFAHFLKASQKACSSQKYMPQQGKCTPTAKSAASLCFYSR